MHNEDHVESWQTQTFNVLYKLSFLLHCKPEQCQLISSIEMKNGAICIFFCSSICTVHCTMYHCIYFWKSDRRHYHFKHFSNMWETQIPVHLLPYSVRMAESNSVLENGWLRPQPVGSGCNSVSRITQDGIWRLVTCRTVQDIPVQWLKKHSASKMRSSRLWLYAKYCIRGII